MSCTEKYMNGNKIEERPCLPIHSDILSNKCLAGTELKALLATMGIKASSNCACNKRALTMDINGCDWCEENIDIIVGWLREEAEKRNLPFVDIMGKILVKKALKNARKNKNK